MLTDGFNWGPSILSNQLCPLGAPMSHCNQNLPVNNCSSAAAIHPSTMAMANVGAHPLCHRLSPVRPQGVFAPAVKCPGAGRLHQQLRRSAVVSRASPKAEQLLADGNRKYNQGDKMAALGFYEKALAEGAALSAAQRQAALYGSTAVHASFGDVELAQMTLRDALQAGLDFEAAQQNPDLPELTSSQQVIIQLNKFNKQWLRTQSERAEDMAAAAARAKATARTSSTKVGADQDLSQLLSSATKPVSEGGVDASPLAIAKRVALVVLAGTILGVVLFFAGLEYMFPKM